MRESWRWLRDVGAVAGHQDLAGWRSLDNVLADLTADGAGAGGRPGGGAALDLPHRGPEDPAPAAALQRAHGHVRQQDGHEPKPPDDPDSPLSFSMEGYDRQPPAALIPRFWAPGWNSVQALNKFQEEVAGPLRGGDPGVRLLRAPEDALPAHFANAPAAFRPRRERWLAVPLYHIFGSDELSVLSPGVAERSPSPYLAVGEADAAALGVAAGAEFTLMLGGRAAAPASGHRPELPAGVAGLPAGLPGLEGLELPRWLELPPDLAGG